MEDESEFPEQGNEDHPESGSDVPGAPTGGGSDATALLKKRAVELGSLVVGLWALVSLESSSSRTAALALLAALVAGIVIVLGRGRSPLRLAGALLVVSAVVVVLASLDLLAVLSDLDSLSEYGGAAGLIGLVAYLGGALLMLVGSFRAWHTERSGPEALDMRELLALIGGTLVVVAWVFMVLAPGWVLVADQAVAVSAATIAAVLVLLRRTRTSPLSPAWTSISVVAACALAVVTGLYGLSVVIPDWGFMLEFGGAPVVVPYIGSLIGHGLLAIAGALMSYSLIGKPGRTATLPITGVTVVILAAVVFTLWNGVESQPAPADTVPTPTAAVPTTGEVEGPQIAPIHACGLLTEFEVIEALGAPFSAEMIFEEGGIGRLRDGADGDSVQEECGWSYYPDADAWVDSDWTMGVRLGPADPQDFEQGAALDGTAAGVEVSGVGNLAVWFSADGEGTISVISETRWGHALVRLLVRQPELDDSGRLEVAKELAVKLLERLERGPALPVEASLCDLLTHEDAEQVLSPFRATSVSADREISGPDTSPPVDLTRPGDASCRKLLLVEIFVALAQGLPTGFGDGVELEGVVGEPVPGVGDEAMWFAGVEEQVFGGSVETGILNVRTGLSHFAIVVGLPDTSPEEQLGIAKRLALGVTSRLAGDGVVVTREPTEAEPLPVDLVDNLLAREQAGEWTRGEGLRMSLELLAGEATVEEVVGAPGEVDDDATVLFLLAEEYLANGSDKAAQTEIERLLDRLIIPGEEWEQMSGPETSGIDARGMLVLAGPLAAVEPEEASPDYCSEYFQTTEKCMVNEPLPGLGENYAFYRPKGDLESGWETKHIDWVREVMLKSVQTFEPLGAMPPTTIVLTQYEVGKQLEIAVEGGATECQINLSTTWQTDPEHLFKELLAFRMARCLLYEEFPAESEDEILVNRWWFQATAIYLGGVVYGDTNVAHDLIPTFQADELSRGLLSRRKTNWLFFEYLHPALHPEGIMKLIRGLPGTLDKTVKPNWHPYNETITDGGVPDIGENTDLVEIYPDKVSVEVEDVGEESFDVGSFGVNRLEVQVANGKRACVEYAMDNSLTVSWRTGMVGSPGDDWSMAPPDELVGQSVFVLTAARTAISGRNPDVTLTVKVNRVVDDSEECEEEEEEPTPPSPPPECPLDSVCVAISDFFKFLEQLPQTVADRLE